VPTPKKDLRGGKPLWADSARIAVRHLSRPNHETCDVAVVGAGISGALVALSLAEKGHDVVILDRRQPCRGSTLASTAMIQFELDTTLSELSDKIGARRAKRVYLRSFRAVRQLEALIHRHGLSCAWKNRDALYLAGDQSGWRALQSEAKQRARIDLPSAFLNKNDLFAKYGIDRTGAIVSSGAAEVNPVQLAAGCLRAAQRLGARLYSPCDVKGVKAKANGVALDLPENATASAKRVIFTTGYEVIPGVPRDRFDIIST
jgi:glycine/D-amino acid oxidase-like deaminating enzyme